jgi:hypothetical protein
MWIEACGYVKMKLLFLLWFYYLFAIKLDNVISFILLVFFFFWILVKFFGQQLFFDSFSSDPHDSFSPYKNPILRLIKNSVRRNRNFSSSNSGKIRFLETKVVFQCKKNQFLEIEIFIEGQNKKYKG